MTAPLVRLSAQSWTREKARPGLMIVQTIFAFEQPHVQRLPEEMKIIT